MAEDKKKSKKTDVDNVLKLIKNACAELEKCLLEDSPELEKTRIEELREEIDMAVAGADNSDELAVAITEFNSLCKKCNDKIHCLYQARDLARWEHYTLKMDLCNEVKKLLECPERDLPRVAREFKLIRLRWKDIGSVPYEKNEEIWNEFCRQCDKLQNRITEYYEQLEQKRTSIAVEKIKICEQAEKLQNLTDWETVAQEFKDLQKLWREVGFTAPECEKELYIRFRAACDIFFNARKKHYQKLKAERDEVNDVKFQLCEEAKTIFDLNYSKAHQLIPDLWKRWKAAGSCGKNDRELYERFRGYFDTYYENLRKQRNENMRIKSELCDKLQELTEELEAGSKKNSDIKSIYLDIKKQWDMTGAMPRAEEKSVLDRYSKLTGQLDSYCAEREYWNREAVKRSFEIEKVISAALEALDSRKIEQFDKYQEAWGNLECVEKKYFRDSFEAITAAFEDESCEHGQKLLELSNENLEKRHKICMELESINKGAQEKTADMDLAAELKKAIANNFGSDPDSRKQKKDFDTEKINELVKSWIKSGPVPLKNLEQVYERFEQAVYSVQSLEE